MAGSTAAATASAPASGTPLRQDFPVTFLGRVDPPSWVTGALRADQGPPGTAAFLFAFQEARAVARVVLPSGCQERPPHNCPWQPDRGGRAILELYVPLDFALAEHVVGFVLGDGRRSDVRFSTAPGAVAPAALASSQPGPVAPSVRPSDARPAATPVPARPAPLPPASAPPVPGSLAVTRDFAGVFGTAPFWDGPPWPSIVATQSRLMIVTSDRIELRSKDGRVVSAATTSEFYASVASSEAQIRNPYMIRDIDTGRVLMVAAIKPSRTSRASDIVLAVSRSPDPASLDTSQWSFLPFTWTVDPDTHVFEAPRVATGTRSIVITAQSDPGDAAPSVGTTVVLDKASALSGATAVRRTEIAPEARTFFNPVRASEPIMPVYLLTRDNAPNSCGVIVWRIDGDGGGATRASRSVAGDRSCAPATDMPQSGGARPVDTLFERARIDAVYANGSIWGVRTMTRAGGSLPSVRWFQIDVSRWPDDARFVQQGWIGEDGAGHAYPGIAAGPDGRLAIALVRGSLSEPASLARTGRLASDPPNALRPVAVLRGGTGLVACADHASVAPDGGIRTDFRNRFAGQSSVALDPEDGSAWLVGSYAAAENEGCQFSTWVGRTDWSVVASLPAAPGSTVRAAFEGAPSASTAAYHPDHALAVGPRSVLLVSNNVVTLLRRDGSRIATSPVPAFFSQRPAGADVGGDPWMTFDAGSGRFFYVSDAEVGNGHVTKCAPGACRAYHLIAVSRGSDPQTLGSDDWYFYALDRTLLRLPSGSVQTANWGDFDNVAVDPDSVVITWPAYAFGIGSGDPAQTQGAKVRILDKAKLIRGDPVTHWTDLEFTDAQGATFEKVEVAEGSGGSVPFFFLGLRGCDVVIWALEAPRASSPPLRSQTVRGRQCTLPGALGATQPGSAAPIFIVFAGHNVVYRAGMLWFSHLVQRGFASGPTSAVRWLQIDVSGWPGPPTTRQDAILEEEGVFHLGPAIAVDGSGNAVMVFGRTSASEYPSLYYTFRSATDPANTLRPPARLRSGSSAWSTSNALLGGRNGWVDFFATAPDPLDGTAWLFGAYVTGQGERGTWVANVSVP